MTPPTIPPKLHPGACSSVACGRGQTGTQTAAITIHFESSTTNAKCNTMRGVRSTKWAGSSCAKSLGNGRFVVLFTVTVTSVGGTSSGEGAF